jgi:hypothetical protein
MSFASAMKFLEHLCRSQRIRVIAGDGCVEALREGAGLDIIRASLRAHLTRNKLPQGFQREVGPVHRLHLDQELVRENRDVRRGVVMRGARGAVPISRTELAHHTYTDAGRALPLLI